MDIQKPVGDKIEKLSINCGKDGPARKTAKYKAVKVSDLRTLWDEFEQNDTNIKLETQDNEEYNKYYDKVKIIYFELKKKLEAIIPYVLSKSDTIDENEIKRELKRQEMRFNALSRSTSEVGDNVFNNVDMTTAYCKTKLKIITDAWDRISEAHERFSMETDDEDYIEKYYATELAMEESMLQLQEILEKIWLVRAPV